MDINILSNIEIYILVFGIIIWEILGNILNFPYIAV